MNPRNNALRFSDLFFPDPMFYPGYYPINYYNPGNEIAVQNFRYMNNNPYYNPYYNPYNHNQNVLVKNQYSALKHGLESESIKTNRLIKSKLNGIKDLIEVEEQRFQNRTPVKLRGESSTINRLNNISSNSRINSSSKADGIYKTMFDKY